MGKKKVAQTTTEGALAEQERVTAAFDKSTSQKKSKRIERGRMYINASYNNTVVTITDLAGNVVAWATSGSLGFSGPKKATPFASSKIIAAIAEKVKSSGPSIVDVIVKGVGGGRDSAVRSLINHGFEIQSLRDVTPIPHNGPRPRKVRRV